MKSIHVPYTDSPKIFLVIHHKIKKENIHLLLKWLFLEVHEYIYVWTANFYTNNYIYDSL
jgi:hypothetical protein